MDSNQLLQTQTPQLPLPKRYLEEAKQIARTLYKNEKGEPLELTDGQAIIFILIFKKLYPRNHLMTYTQYGKSFTVALAILTRVATFGEKWAIVAGRSKQAMIIMNYMIEHAFDNEYTRNKLEIDKGESLDRLRRERSKNKLVFKHEDGSLGEVFVLSADSRNKQTAGESVMGFGAPNVVLDEAALIDDDIESKIFRMLGAQPENFYFKIGNPFRRNHFYADYKSPGFYKVRINYDQGIKEGRLRADFIEEARKKPNFDVLYENCFPDADLIDDQNYVPLFAEKDINFTATEEFNGPRRMGIDPSGKGSDITSWVVRDRFKARIVATEQISNPKSIAEKTITLMKHLKIKPEDVYIDNFGEGANVAQEIALATIQRKDCRLMRVKGVNVGDRNCDSRYINKRAEAFWRVKQWMRGGGELYKQTGWAEVLKLKYRNESNGKLKIMSKEEMAKRGIPSPNNADALMLTFYSPDIDRPKTKQPVKQSFNPLTGELRDMNKRTNALEKMIKGV